MLLDQSNNQILIYSDNPFYENWKNENNRKQLIEVYFTNRGLRRFKSNKKNYLEIENYSFKQIIEKYSLDNSIVAVFFKNENEIRVLSKIIIKENKVIKSNSFKNIDLNNIDNINQLISDLKIIYEDFLERK